MLLLLYKETTVVKYSFKKVFLLLEHSNLFSTVIQNVNINLWF